MSGALRQGNELTFALLASIAVVVGTACETSPVPSATVETPWVIQTTARTSSFLTVDDASGLVASATRFPIQVLREDSLVEALPDDRVINVAWSGGACDGSRLLVAGTADELFLTLTVHHGVAMPPGTECPAEGLFHGVSLMMSEPVQQDAVALTVT